MPGSNMSRLTIHGDGQTCEVAAQAAKAIAQQEIGLRIKKGLIRPQDTTTIAKEYRAIYNQEYYKHYAHFLQQDQQSRIIYVPTENPSARKFYVKHAVANFSKLNCFVHVHRRHITVGRINYDEDSSLDTKEAYLSSWPGPLDRTSVFQLNKKISSYIDTLIQNDPQRQIRYTNINHENIIDEQRKTILKLLKELIVRNGSIDAPAITELLVNDDKKIEIRQKDGKLETLQKHLLLGKRIEAIKFAKASELWDHAQCIAFLDKYQPPNTGNYHRDGLRLKDDPIVQLNVDYITALDNRTLNTVYRALLNRILKSDPESVSIVKNHNVNNDSYEFAILSANDCEMDFDQTNEIFKLIIAVKQAIQDQITTNKHLICLGFATIDSADTSEDYSLRSHQSYLQTDTPASRTLLITNIDMLILNEIWEYCLNLARGTSNPTDYDYIIDLVPYKLIFASKLLDFGLYQMFSYYIGSIKSALEKSRKSKVVRDPFYDWTTIEKCVDYLESIWELFKYSPEAIPQNATIPESPPMQQNNNIDHSSPTSSGHHHQSSGQVVQNEFNSDVTDAAQNIYYFQSENPYPYMNHDSYYMKQNLPPPILNQPSIQEEEEVNDYNPTEAPSQIEDTRAYYDSPHHQHSQHQNYSNYPDDSSRRDSGSKQAEASLFSPPTISSVSNQQDNRVNQKMTTSSPVYSNRDSFQQNPQVGESFTSPYSPINEYDDIGGQDTSERRGSGVTESKSVNNFHPSSNTSAPSSSSNAATNNNKSQPSGDHQGSFLTSLFGSAGRLLPKSRSNQMILPDDSSKTMVYDHDKKAWIDTSQPDNDEQDDLDDAPPVMNITKPPAYSFGTKKNRYPPPPFKNN